MLNIEGENFCGFYITLFYSVTTESRIVPRLFHFTLIRTRVEMISLKSKLNQFFLEIVTQSMHRFIYSDRRKPRYTNIPRNHSKHIKRFINHGIIKFAKHLKRLKIHQVNKTVYYIVY